MQTEEIHALVRRAQAGDKAATAALVEAFRPLLRAAVNQAAFAPVREDAAQEAALAFLLAVARFDEKRGVPFAGFAKSLVHGRVRTFFSRERQRWRREVLPRGRVDKESGETEDYFAGVADERDEIGAFEDAESFRAALTKRSRREQEILTLYYEKDLPLREIGARLGMNENLVSVVKARAMKKLRRTLGAEQSRRRRGKENRRP